MPSLLAVLILVQQATVPPAQSRAAPFADSASVASAYLDASARDLVSRARARRAVGAARVTAYHATVIERISVGIRALRRDRVIYRREMAGRVAWRRGGGDSVTMLGAREVIPIVETAVHLPDDLRSDAPGLAFDPTDDRLFDGPNDSDFVFNPVAPGSEANYRFASGDTTVITLPDGQSVQLLELRVTARREEFRLMMGSIWLDGATAEVVRALFRPARPFDLDRDVAEADVGEHIPGLLKPIRAEVGFITIEYGLWEHRWWMPRLLAVDAVGTAGFITAPVRYERLYSDFVVEGDTTNEAATVKRARCHHRHHMHKMGDSTAVGDTAIEKTAVDKAAVSDTAATDSTDTSGCFTVVVPPDSLSLLTSELLPGALLGSSDELLTQSDAQDIADRLNLLPRAPWRLQAPSLRFGIGGAGLLRYNRVEALSVGAREVFDFGRVSLDLSARVGLADRQPNGEARLWHELPQVRWGLAGYRRLAVANPSTNPLGFMNSANALLFARDDGAYYRTAGAELTLDPATTVPQSYSWRLYAEHQSGVSKQTDVSLPHLVSNGQVFGPNIAARTADEVGAALTLRGARGSDPTRIRGGADVTIDVALGTYDVARLSFNAHMAMPLSSHVLAAVEGGVGTSAGPVPPQELWYVGGPATLRGYSGFAAAGENFWRGRVELANRFPGARLLLFSDAGWAGPRAAGWSERPLLSAGIGASFLDGLVRLDLARALRAPRGWRLDCYVDGIL